MTNMMRLRPAPDIELIALPTSLGFTREEGEMLTSCRPLYPEALDLISLRLHRAFSYLANCECEGEA